MNLAKLPQAERNVIEKHKEECLARLLIKRRNHKQIDKFLSQQTNQEKWINLIEAARNERYSNLFA